ncbi:hypothetical protein [Cardinium endosymbiont of Dermatophagoides farinae]|uniref:hypothetical protein n=1 Tax=Cardinium endosymbiont of Dermatophagoides farinae TaxID=2597823 RepID=UPI0011830B61|nr:hypothetical protein [Cardinium endosymbiont of Dermatophagoides farinae]TSJ81050.1 hypothetical protein FPG78_03425 [Cardinium endosymbiont of Dermatophagoides farinae]
MPEIEAFPVSEKITHKFVKDAVATSGGDRNDAPFGVEITNGQLLNTLFKGDNKSVDFMRFYFDDKTEASPYFFKIQSSNDAFQSVLNLAKNDQDTAKFATMLGHHITDAQTGLENLIFIPDRLEIQNDILKNIGDSKSVGEKKQANEEGKPISNYEEFSKDGFDPIGGGSIAGRLFVNLARILGYDSSDPNTAFNKCMIHITDANIDVSDATINQKIAIEILKSLLDKGKPFIQPATKEFVITSDSEGSAKKLIESVEGTIKSQVEKAVVYREGNLFFGTPVTEHIMRFIREMGNALSEKHGDAHITYKTISDVTNKAFKIADVIKAAEADFKDIRSAMRAKVSSFLNDKESLSLENYSTYFPDVSLRSAHITQFNQLKSEYINKNKDKKLSPDI